MKNIEAKSSLSLSKKNPSNNSNKKIIKKTHQVEKYTLVSKTTNELQDKGDMTNSEENHIIWKFIYHEGINLIDLYDALKSFDKNKLFNKVKEEINEKNKKNGKSLSYNIHILLYSEQVETNLVSTAINELHLPFTVINRNRFIGNVVGNIVKNELERKHDCNADAECRVRIENAEVFLREFDFRAVSARKRQ